MINKIKDNSLVAAIIGGVCAIALIVIAVIFVNTVNQGGTATIKYSDEKRNATITVGEDSVEEESGLGEAGEEIPIDDIPTVEEVDANGPVVNADAGEDLSVLEDGEEHGLGAFIYAPTDSPSAFKQYVLGKCLNTDGAYGAQCWDLADVFWQNYAGRRAQTCGTGAAKGMIGDGCWQKNAGNEFAMIWNPKDIQAGDWVIFTNGTWGHVGMALGSYNNGYVTLLGQNQGGSSCDGGGSSANIINISLANFGGAFRPKTYIKPAPAPEPTPEPTPTPINTYIVKPGDTLGGIARSFCGYTGKYLFGNDGFAQKMATANGILNRGLIYPKQTIKCPTE